MHDTRPGQRPLLTMFAVVVAGLLLAAHAKALSQEPAKDPAHYRTSVVILGAGTPKADPERSGPAIAVVVGERSFIFDAGPGIVRRAQAAADRGNPALAMNRLDTLFITHLHSDHTLGLPDFIFSPWVLGRERNPRIYGPPGTARMVDHITAAWSEDIAMRRSGLQAAKALGFAAEVTEIAPGLVFEEDGVRIEAILARHGKWVAAFSYRVTTPDKIVVISGDTGFSPELAEFAKSADILLHEVFSSSTVDRSRNDADYHRSFHTSTEEVAEIARRAQPKLLVLYHQLFWGASDAELIQQVRSAGYDGAIVSARDLDVYS